MKWPVAARALLLQAARTAGAYRINNAFGHIQPGLDGVSLNAVMNCNETLFVTAGQMCTTTLKTGNVSALNPNADCSKASFLCISLASASYTDDGGHQTNKTVPASATSTSDSDKAVSCEQGYFYSPRSDDTASSLMTLFGLSLSSFNAMNPSMNSNTGLTGQPICLSDFPLSLNSSAPTTSSSSPCYKFAKVVSPSSCVDIANAHNVSLASLATLNHGLQCNNLKFLDAICVAGPGTPSFAGANSYILHSFHPSTRDQTIKDLAMAGVKVVRIFLKRTWAGEKYGSDNLSMDDIENDHVGVYNDTMLNAIDELMFVASQHGIKLLLCMHDRYNLDATFDLDGYFNDFVEGGTLELFYSNPAAQSAFDKRLEHIVNHVNPLMGGRKWRDIPEGIYAFEIENEAQGEGKTSLNVYSNPQWWCQRATALRQGALKTSFIPISSGGGKDFSTSMRDEMFACDALDIITLHSYTGSLDEVSSSLSSAFQKAQEHKKMILYEEFGSASDKGGWLSQVGGVANSLHVPFMVWEVLQTASPPSNDFEFYTDNVNAWGALTSVAQAALKAI